MLTDEFVRVLDMKSMAIPIVEFSMEGYKIRKVVYKQKNKNKI
jgi:hypothetical protein